MDISRNATVQPPNDIQGSGRRCEAIREILDRVGCSAICFWAFTSAPCKICQSNALVEGFVKKDPEDDALLVSVSNFKWPFFGGVHVFTFFSGRKHLG